MAKKFQKLSRNAIRALKPGQKITEHGITFERLADGDGRYSVNFMCDGKRIHRVIGRESERTSRTQAEDFIAVARDAAKRGRLDLPSGRKNRLLFKEAAAKYVEMLTREGGRDVTEKERRLRLRITPHFGSSPLNAISDFDVERYKKKQSEAGLAKATINRDLAVLSHLFNKAIAWNWIDVAPTRVKKYKLDNARITYLTSAQCAALIEAARHDANAHIHLFIQVALGTAMRRSEILRIRCEHVDLDTAQILIPQAKAGARVQPVTPTLIEHLRRQMEQVSETSEWLFPSPRADDGHAVSIIKPFRRVVIAAGLDPSVVTPHTLRHTAITHLVQAGVDLPTVKRISGHKTLAMVERYSHQNGAHIEAAMSKLAGRYGET